MSAFLASAILLSSMSVYAETESVETTESMESETDQFVNESFTASEIIPDIFSPARDTIYDSVDEAADELRSQMMMRRGTITVNYSGKDSEKQAEVILQKALDYDSTTLGCGGDYLRYHCTDIEPSTYIVTTGGEIYYQYEYEVTYFSSAKQEMAVEDEVSRIIKHIDRSDDINIISNIYKEVVENGRSDQTDKVSFNPDSAYAALVEKNASSEGYAAALYRLLREAEIECRIVVGKVGDETQAWNMVELNGIWYYLNAYEDLGKSEWTAFLKGVSFAQTHVQDDSDDIISANDYKVSEKDYTGEIPITSEDQTAKGHSEQEETAAGLNDTQLWINQCYVYLYGRDGDAKELAVQEAWFNEHEQDMQALILNLIQSDEFYKTHTTEDTGYVLEKLFADEIFVSSASMVYDGQLTVFVYRAYNCILNRQPDLNSLKYFLKELTEQKKTPEEVCLALVDSDEAKGIKLDDEAYIAAMYTIFLGRTPDADGLTYWKKELKNSERKTILHTFANSDECKKKYSNAKFEK